MTHETVTVIKIVELGILGFALWEIVQTVRDNLRHQKIESHEILKAKVDRFTVKNGQRFEDPDDAVQERAS